MSVERLLDTDVAIQLIRGREPGLQHQFAEARGCGVSSVTVAELTYGAANAAESNRELILTTAFLRLVAPCPFDVAAARRAGEVRATLATRGTPIGSYDVLIAGHALALGVPLVTRNKREFERVAGLAIETW